MVEPAAQSRKKESGRGQRERHANPVAEHQRDTEEGPAERDGAEQDDEGGRARDQSAGDSHPDESAAAERAGRIDVVVSVSVVMPVRMVVCVVRMALGRMVRVTRRLDGRAARYFSGVLLFFFLRHPH